MTDPATILALIQAGRTIITGALRQAELAHAEGALSQEELDSIKAEAAIADSAWDPRVADARARLGR